MERPCPHPADGDGLSGALGGFAQSSHRRGRGSGIAASRGLPQGVATFFGTSVWAGILLWGAASLGFVAVHAALWSSSPGRWMAFRYLIAAGLMAIPPFGIGGWAHPVTGAGVLFPGWGWWGFIAGAALLLVMTTRAWPIAAAGIVGLRTWSAVSWSVPPAPAGWLGINAVLSSALGEEHALDQHRTLAERAKRAFDSGARVVAFPESSLGVLTPTRRALLDRRTHRSRRDSHRRRGCPRCRWLRQCHGRDRLVRREGRLSLSHAGAGRHVAALAGLARRERRGAGDLLRRSRRRHRRPEDRSAHLLRAAPGLACPAIDAGAPGRDRRHRQWLVGNGHQFPTSRSPCSKPGRGCSIFLSSPPSTAEQEPPWPSMPTSSRNAPIPA